MEKKYNETKNIFDCLDDSLKVSPILFDGVEAENAVAGNVTHPMGQDDLGFEDKTCIGESGGESSIVYTTRKGETFLASKAEYEEAIQETLRYFSDELKERSMLGDEIGYRELLMKRIKVLSGRLI